MQIARDFYINGEWVAPRAGTDFDVINPSNEEAFATISLGGDKDTNAAVSAAKSAFVSWSISSKAERLDLIQNILDIYETRREDMGAVISQEMGAQIDMACSSQAGAGISHTKAIISTLRDFQFEQFLTDDTPHDRIFYEPIGVCGLITPWNWPINQIALKVIPALAAGCTMVLKPSEESPLCAMLYAEILHEAGVPKGVFNLINGNGLGVGTQLSCHPDVDMISFTGSTRAGAAITKNAANSVKRVSLELGGKGANIIFEDADADAVARGAKHCFGNVGQSCNAPSRMLVHRSRYEEAIEQAIEVAENTKVDLAEKHGDHLGPLVNEIQFGKVQDLIDIGIKEGAKLVAGGLGRPEGLNRGFFVRPTVFADCHNDMDIMRKEIFGPVLSMMAFDTEEEAVQIANDTPYGLTNYLQTQDMDKAARVSRQLRSGMVEINGHSRASILGSPFGGYKQSGNGREGGKFGLEEFLEVKAISGWDAQTG